MRRGEEDAGGGWDSLRKSAMRGYIYQAETLKTPKGWSERKYSTHHSASPLTLTPSIHPSMARRYGL